MHQVIDILRKIVFFEGLDDDTLKSIYACAKAITIYENNTIFHQDDQGGSMYLIVTGKVEIYQTDAGGYTSVLAKLGASDIIGEMSLIDNLPRSASAKALEKTVLFEISGQDFQKILRSNFSLTLKILELLSKRLRIANEKLANRNRRGYFPE